MARTWSGHSVGIAADPIGRLARLAFLDFSRLEVKQVEVKVPTHPLSRQLIEFWQAHRIDGRLLSRRDIPSRDIVKLMPFLILHEPVDSKGSDWRCRLEGAGVYDRFGLKNPRGLTLAQRFSPDQAATGAVLFSEIAQGEKPYIARGRIIGIERDFYEVENVILPIEGNAGRRWLFGGMFFFE